MDLGRARTIVDDGDAPDAAVDRQTGLTPLQPDHRPALRDAERRANAIVAENRAVRLSFEDSSSATGLRKASDRGGTLRVVTIDALDRMINNYSASLLAPDAYLKLAQTHAQLVEGPNYDQGSTKEAITYFDDFLILFPNDPNISQAAKGLDSMKQVLSESKIVIGDFYFKKRKNYAAARVFYNEAITVYPDSPVAAKARQKLAQVEAQANHQPPPPGTAPKKKRFFFF